MERAIHIIEVDSSKSSDCTICNFLNISLGLLSALNVLNKQNTPMQPLAASFMLGHSAELIAKACLLQSKAATEEELRNTRADSPYGHEIKNMWYVETNLANEATAYWNSVKSTRFGCEDADFDHMFDTLASLHERPFKSRYGGQSSFPLHEPLTEVFWQSWEKIYKENEKAD